MNDVELYDYTYRQFLELPHEEMELYKAYGLHAKPRNLTDKDPMQWEWARVKQVQDLIGSDYVSWNDLTEAVVIASMKSRDEVLELQWHQVLKFYRFLVSTIKYVNEREQQLSYEPDAAEMNAGIDRYQQFSWFATLYRLAGGDPLKYDAIGKMPYSEIFATLLLQKTDVEYNKALIKKNNNV